MPDTKSVSGCKRCKKVTTSGLKCIVCGIVSHPSCLNSIKNAKKIDENSCNCCGEINESACAIADISTDNLLEKLKHFEELVISKNQTIQYQEIAIKSLQDQVGLLQKSLCSVSIQYPKKISTASDAREDDNSLSSHEVNKVFSPINTPNQTSLITAQNASRAIENAQTSNIFNKLIHINSESASSSKRVVSTTQRASRNLFTGNMSACNNLQLKASVKPINPDMKLLHSIYWDPDTDTDELSKYLQKIVPDLKVEKLNSRHPQDYSSFKISVPKSEMEKIMKPELWPSGVRINEFFLSRKRQINNLSEQANE